MKKTLTPKKITLVFYSVVRMCETESSNIKLLAQTICNMVPYQLLTSIMYRACLIQECSSLRAQ
jgi:hypothetical protein